MNALEIVSLLLEADQLSAGTTSGVYIFGPALPPEGYLASSVEAAIRDFRRRGIIHKEAQDRGDLLDQLVQSGYTFLLKKAPGDIEVIGRVPAQTTPEGQEYADRFLGMENQERVQYRATPTATPTSLEAQRVMYSSKSLAQTKAPKTAAQDEMQPLDSPVEVGITFDRNSRRGIKVYEVHPGGPAALAGVQAGDIIVASGKFTRRDGSLARPYALHNSRHLEYVLRIANHEYPVPLKIVRGDKTMWLPVVPAQKRRGSSVEPSRVPGVPVTQTYASAPGTPARETGNVSANVSSLT